MLLLLLLVVDTLLLVVLGTSSSGVLCRLGLGKGVEVIGITIAAFVFGLRVTKVGTHTGGSGSTGEVVLCEVGSLVWVCTWGLWLSP